MSLVDAHRVVEEHTKHVRRMVQRDDHTADVRLIIDRVVRIVNLYHMHGAAAVDECAARCMVDMLMRINIPHEALNVAVEYDLNLSHKMRTQIDAVRDTTPIFLSWCWSPTRGAPVVLSYDPTTRTPHHGKVHIPDLSAIKANHDLPVRPTTTLCIPYSRLRGHVVLVRLLGATSLLAIEDDVGFAYETCRVVPLSIKRCSDALRILEFLHRETNEGTTRVCFCCAEDVDSTLVSLVRNNKSGMCPAPNVLREGEEMRLERRMCVWKLSVCRGLPSTTSHGAS